MTGEIELFNLGGGEDCRFGVDPERGPYVVASDYAKRLGHRDAANALRCLEPSERGTQIVSTPGGPQEMSVIYEDGIWELIFLSRRPEAKVIKARVKEILRALRRGDLELRRPLSRRELAENWADAERRAEIASQRAAELEPSATAWDRLASATGDYSVRQAAFILNRDPKISTGQNRLFKTLRQFGMVDANDVPYATHAEHVRLRPRAYDSPLTGEPKTSDQVRVTVAGLRYLHRRMGGIAPLRFDGPEQPDLFEDGAA